MEGTGEEEGAEDHIFTGLLSGFVYRHSRLVSIVEATGLLTETSLCCIAGDFVMNIKGGLRGH